jgi:peroxiredoxin
MKRSILLALAILPVIGYAQNGAFVINGKVGTIGPPAKAYIHYTAGHETILDSAVIKNGVFRFTGRITDPVKAQVLINHKGAGLPKPGQKGNDVLNLYLEQATITIIAKDSIERGVITGSRVNDENAKYKAFVAKPDLEMAKVNAYYVNADESRKKDPAFINVLQNRMKKAMEDKVALSLDFVKQNPDSYFSLLALSQIAGSSPDLVMIAPLYNSLSARVKHTAIGQTMGKEFAALDKVAVNKPAPDFTQNDVNDKPVKLSSFRGKYVLLDFWASWCGPCRAENPNVVKAYQKYKNKNFTIVGVSLDKPGKKADWMAAIKQDGLVWTQVSDLKYGNNAVAKLYGVLGIPQNFLIDPSGKIIAINLRGDELNKKLKEIFGS